MNKAAQQLGRLGGKATSEAKAAAARANGKLGGRPKKPKRVARRSKILAGINARKRAKAKKRRMPNDEDHAPLRAVQTTEKQNQRGRP